MHNQQATVTYLSDLAGACPVKPGSVGHHTMQVQGARVVVLSFEAGAVLKDHRAPFPLLLHALDGHLTITAEGAEHSLQPGALLHLQRSTLHAVRALEASRLCLILLGAGPG